MTDHVGPDDEAGSEPNSGALGDADPAPASARRALPPLAPPLDRGVQPVAAITVLVALVVALWLRRRYLRYRLR